MAFGEFTPKVKEAIWRRAAGRCDRCGLRVERMHFHHRTPRRSGGTSRPDLGLPSNGLLLHPSCHDAVESRRKASAELGFLVGYGREPRDMPVMLWSGWHWLNDDGTATKIAGVPSLNEKRPEPSEAGSRPVSEGVGPE